MNGQLERKVHNKIKRYDKVEQALAYTIIFNMTTIFLMLEKSPNEKTQTFYNKKHHQDPAKKKV